jgi:hypothetical protein
MRLRGSPEECSGLALTSSNFSSVSTRRVDSVPFVCPVFTYGCMIFCFLTFGTFRNVCFNLPLTFHMGIVHKRSFQCVNVTWHFDTRSNATD